MQEAKQQDDYGDFKEITEENQESEDSPNEEFQQVARARMPRDKERIGMIVQRLGGNRMEIKTTDGKTRNCRVPGRYKRKLWLRPKDIVLTVPDEFNNEKGDVIYKYPPAAINQLRKKGILDSLKEEF